MEGLKKYSCKEIVEFLKEKSIDSVSLQAIQSNEMDGETMDMLVEDVAEFSYIIPKSSSRLKIKSLMKTLCGPHHSENTGITTNIANSLADGVEIEGCHSNMSFTSNNEGLTSSTECQSASEHEIDMPPIKKRKLDVGDFQQSSSVEFDINNINFPTSYSKKVQDAIDNGHLNKTEFRLAFIRESVQQMEGRLPRPSTEQYKAISKAFCDKFPQLRNNSSDYWYTFNRQFTQRFRNVRRQANLSGSQTTSFQHVKHVTSDSTKSTSFDKDNKYGGYNGNDEEYEETIEALKTLFRQGRNPPAASNVQNLLKASFVKRREWLKTSLISIHNIMEKYPLFKHSKWLLYEFSLAVDNTEIVQKMQERWQDVMKTMNGSDNYDEFTGFSLELTTFQIINKNIYQRQPTEDNIITFEQTGIDPNSIVNTIAEPQLLIFLSEGCNQIEQILLILEKDIVIEDSDLKLVSGLSHLVAAYYVFHVAYPKKFKMKMMGGEKRPVRYTTFLTNSGLSKL